MTRRKWAQLFFTASLGLAVVVRCLLSPWPPSFYDHVSVRHLLEWGDEATAVVLVEDMSPEERNKTLRTLPSLQLEILIAAALDLNLLRCEEGLVSIAETKLEWLRSFCPHSCTQTLTLLEARVAEESSVDRAYQHYRSLMNHPTPKASILRSLVRVCRLRTDRLQTIIDEEAKRGRLHPILLVGCAEAYENQDRFYEARKCYRQLAKLPAHAELATARVAAIDEALRLRALSRRIEPGDDETIEIDRTEEPPLLSESEELHKHFRERLTEGISVESCINAVGAPSKRVASASWLHVDGRRVASSERLTYLTEDGEHGVVIRFFYGELVDVTPYRRTRLRLRWRRGRVGRP